MLLIPNYVADAINAAIDKAIDGRPCAAGERETIYCALLLHFEDHGVIPDFSLKAKMKTKDGVEYTPGMTLYHVYAGEISVRPTRVEQGRNAEYVSGITDGSYQVDAHYANKESAFIEATNHWLRILELGRTKLAEVNRERTACLLGPSTARSPSPPVKTTEPAATASVSNADKPISDTLSTSGS